MFRSASLSDFLERLRALGARPEHERAILRAWLLTDDWSASASMRRPKALEAMLPDLRAELESAARVVSSAEGREAGAGKLLLELRDGGLVETVLLPRDGLCISTQIGCAVGCVFCMTGRSGLVRQLSSLEILAEVREGLRRAPGLRKVKLMGMGEPSHNRRAVFEVLECLGGVLEFAHKKLVVSTVGDPGFFEELAGLAVRPALALSLHSTDDARRRELLPRAPKVPVEALLEAACRYAEQVKFPLQIEWTLVAGLTDREEEVERLAELVAGRPAMVNFIAFNRLPGSSFAPPERARCEDLITIVRRTGTVATLRESAASDLDAGCGQLRARRIGEDRA